MSIDLHCHTRYSDGSTPLEELIQLAALRGVTTFALTATTIPWRAANARWSLGGKRA